MRIEIYQEKLNVKIEDYTKGNKPFFLILKLTTENNQKIRFYYDTLQEIEWLGQEICNKAREIRLSQLKQEGSKE
jgi:hypothetical protein